MYSFEKVVDGIVRWISAEIFPRMNDLQEIAVRILLGRLIDRSEVIKTSLSSNGIVRTFGIIDADGMIDVDLLMSEIKREIDRKGKIEVEIPLIGKLKFVAEDVDTLCGYIKGGHI
jgi:hypothetical protein